MTAAANQATVNQATVNQATVNQANQAPATRDAPGRRWFTGDCEQPPRCWFLCFPHAGAGAAGYLRLSKLLPPGIALRVAQLPGREGRFREPPYRDVRALARALMPAIETMAGRPVVLFGHSLGAIAAFEVAREMRRQGLPPPAHLYVSGRQAPHIGMQGRATWDLHDEALIATLRELGGTPETVLGDPELFALLAPALRADLEMNERYEYTPAESLPTAVTAFAAAKDPRAAPGEVAAWAGHTTGRFAFVPVAGGHFALLERPRLLMDRVLTDDKDWI
jgi:medium-chain acyl-[acyl-carrier-protein] hydrolase